MPDREPFMRMICDHPDDDGPRLVYADWLEERGDTARSEFIRLQIERSRLPADDSESRMQLSVRCDELHRVHGGAWRAELPPLPGISWGVFHRGFVHNAVAQSAEAFLAHAEMLFCASPVDEVWFQNLGVEGAKLLAESPLLARIAVLNVSNAQLGDDGLRLLAESKYVANLKSLLADRNGFSADGAGHIAASKHLTNLRELFLPANQIGDTGAQALAASKGLRLVEEISVAGNNLHEAGIAALRRRWGDKVSV
ncbi:MAG: TIGR02996 domain-containing protein [Gemmataceae bacterium]